MNQSIHPEQAYVMSFSTEETRRLQKQAELLSPTTRRFLKEAGIAEGMKVLDVGCGAGDVSLLIAELVGPTGAVVGVDSSLSMLQVARMHVQASSFSNVSFVQADISVPLQYVDGDFDAIVGRFILLHMKQPAIVLRQLSRHLRPGGIVAFEEPDFTYLGAGIPSSPLAELTGVWVREPLRCVGLDHQIGMRLYQIFLEAGLPAPQLNSEAALGAGADWAGYDVVAETIRTLLPVLVKFGIATEEEVGIDTLTQRFRDEVVRQRSVVRGPDVISAWTRTESALM